MERYASFIGKRVEAHYRSADIHLFAVGVIVADNGKSIYLEDRFASGGTEKMMRLELPYTHVVRIVELGLSDPALVPMLRPTVK
jgi:hypothetical protein